VARGKREGGSLGIHELASVLGGERECDMLRIYTVMLRVVREMRPVDHGGRPTWTRPVTDPVRWFEPPTRLEAERLALLTLFMMAMDKAEAIPSSPAVLRASLQSRTRLCDGPAADACQDLDMRSAVVRSGGGDE
jgi:hypothetical protein